MLDFGALSGVDGDARKEILKKHGPCVAALITQSRLGKVTSKAAQALVPCDLGTGCCGEKETPCPAHTYFFWAYRLELSRQSLAQAAYSTLALIAAQTSQSSREEMSKARPVSTISGSCLCGAVQYSCTGNDRGAVLCHCRNCQKGSGSAFAYNYRFLKAKLTFTQGENMVKEYADKATKTGNTVFRHFCKECGSPIHLSNSAFEGLVVLHTGLMDSTPNGTPSAELFAENRKDWFAGVPKAKI